ncbi:class I SAM-dependent methyltransferase [Paenibacillus eucommiae]|uniref:SAM-dependent MidA family methyltransferase n=1 Tax=Paenibacillus eucommiae TaxID=1355755 RepID=A0ABS4IYZ4_9BACL|nr:SAM-dependent methyltransferase [Paenibacillus eucommiae]MBP1992813.1 SAM-dependent MidA family methyltransferase [Paenibacillus eucommiae]
MTDSTGSKELTKVIAERICASTLKAIPFRDYMELCLYQEPFGYYRNSAIKIGKEGDFYTSSSVSPLMGEMIASYLIKQWRAHFDQVERIFVVEWGGGNGRLALHVLDELREQEPQLYKRLAYTMIESSSYHRGLQQETLLAHTGKVNYLDEQDWLQAVPDQGVFVLANELLDAFPVHRICLLNGLWHESYVSWEEEQGSFKELWLPLQEGRLLTYISQYKPLSVLLEGQIAEINLAAMDWIGSVARRIGEGQLILIDYGDTAEELYAGHRMRGTLMCYRKHLAYDDPFIYVGEQDITAHVNFSACVAAGEAEGMTALKLQTQREFLVEQGILEKLMNHFDPDPFSPVAKKNRGIRQLLLSDQMSELFKVLILTKKR